MPSERQYRTMGFPFRGTLLLWTLIAAATLRTSLAQIEPPTKPQFATPQTIPDRGAVPPVVDPQLVESVHDMALAAEYGPYKRQLRALARRYFTNRRNSEIREEGYTQLQGFTDTGALFAMPFTLDRQKPDVIEAMFDHMASSGSNGQAALAWTAIHHENEEIRAQATNRISATDDPLVLAVIEHGLRDTRHAVVNAAGKLAGTINAFQTIPLLIFSQYSRDEVRSQGDLAWIAIGTQQSYVQNLIPVAGNEAGGFQPVIGTITEGFVMRVTDYVAIVYRTEVHYSLVKLADSATGQSTEHLGWDMRRWRDWYNSEYLPQYQAKAAEAALQERAEEIARREHARTEEAD